MNIITKRAGLAGDEQRWRHHLALHEEAQQRVLSKEPQSSDAPELLRHSSEIAGAAAGLADADMLCRALTIAATTGAAAMLACRFHDGEILLSGEINRTIPAGSTSFAPPLWFQATCAASLMRDGEALAILCHPDHVALSVSMISPDDSVGNAPFWKPFCTAFAALIRQEPAAALLAETAVNKATSEQIGAIIPESIAAIYVPFLNLVAQLAAGKTENWTASVMSAVARFDQFGSHEDRAYFSSTFLPLGIAAVCACAYDRGIPFNEESPYLPLWLIHGDLKRFASSVIYSFPARIARNSREIHWYFDLEGVPVHGREHQLIERNHQLVARYSVQGWPGVPRVHADFTCSESSTHATLLDAGELMLVADQHASQVDADPQGAEAALRDQRMHLQDAIDAIGSIIALVPANEKKVPGQRFRSARGRAVWFAEPGRFELERLQAVNRTYQEIGATLDERLRSFTQGSSQSTQSDTKTNDRSRALAAMEIIRAQVLPILQAIARDRTGETIKILAPRASDFVLVFTGAAVEAARQAYTAMWQTAPPIKYPSPEQTELRCFVAPAGMLIEENELSRNFPAGYRMAAPWLVQSRVWVAWKFTEPGRTSGLAYNGLVWCDDHWAWFPKPYQALASIAGNARK